MASRAPASIPGKKPAAIAAAGNLLTFSDVCDLEESIPDGAVAVAVGEEVLLASGTDVVVPFW